jgi:signal peptidase I
MSSDTSRSAPSASGPGPDGAGAHRKPRERSGGGFFRELPFLVVIAFLLALLIKAFLVQAFYIPSGSMQQTLELRDRVLVNKLVYDFREIHRGEVVVFNGLDSFTPETEIAPPSNAVQRVLRWVAAAVGVGAPGEKDFIKRVIGVPGDRVACCSNGKVTVQPGDGSAPVELDEPYVFEDDRMVFCAAGTGEAACPPGAEGVLVPEGRLWVMGDHRGSSADSRFHIDDENNGTVPQDKVIGRAFVIVWPLDRAGLLRVPETFDGALTALGPLPSYGLAATPYALGLVGALPVVALRRRWRRRR